MGVFRPGLDDVLVRISAVTNIDIEGVELVFHPHHLDRRIAFIASFRSFDNEVERHVPVGMHHTERGLMLCLHAVCGVGVERVTTVAEHLFRVIEALSIIHETK